MATTPYFQVIMTGVKIMIMPFGKMRCFYGLLVIFISATGDSSLCVFLVVNYKTCV